MSDLVKAAPPANDPKSSDVKAAGAGPQALFDRAAFADVLPLARYVQRFIPDTQLWDALVTATRQVLGTPPSDGPPRGIVVADDPLLGLAAAQLFASPEVGVPISRASAGSDERLISAVATNTDLRRFVRSCRGLGPANGPLLMLGWNATGVAAAAEAALAEAVRHAAFDRGLVCMLQSKNAGADGGTAVWGGVEALPILADVSGCAAEVVARTLRELKFPSFVDVTTDARAEQLVADLMRNGSTLATLINALNTPAHGDFQRLAYRVRSAERAGDSDNFRRNVLDAQEDRPRHAASLFLVSHFPRLTPAQFIELGDALALQTPGLQRSERWRRPPDVITDVVLADCKIAFVHDAQGGATAVLGTGAGTLEADPLGVRASEHLRLQFEQDAPLLKERYLRFLAGNLLLGHASDAVAEQYWKLEVAALRAAAVTERHTTGARLRRIIYGAPPPAPAGATAADGPAELTEAFLRAIGRSPDLIEAYVGSASDIELHETVADLCSTQLFRTEYESHPTIRKASAWVFWLLYAKYQGRLSLAAFPSLADRELAEAADRRADCLTIVRALIETSERAAVQTRKSFSFEDPTFLARLVIDIAEHYPRIVGNGQEWVDVALLVEAGTSYLRRALHDTQWSAVAPWPAVVAAAGGEAPLDSAGGAGAPRDLVLARIVCSLRVNAWIIDPSRRLPGTDDERLRIGEGRTRMTIACAVIDALVGLSAFDEWQITALDVWFRRAFGTLAVDYQINFLSDWFWQHWCTPMEEPDEWWTRMQAAVAPVLSLFPLILIMAATHEAPSADRPVAFAFSAPLRDWLGVIEKGMEHSPAQSLLMLVDGALKVQDAWRSAHGEVLIPDLDWARIEAAMSDREQALDAFGRMLEPIARESHPPIR